MANVLASTGAAGIGRSYESTMALSFEPSVSTKPTVRTSRMAWSAVVTKSGSCCCTCSAGGASAAQTGAAVPKESITANKRIAPVFRFINTPSIPTKHDTLSAFYIFPARQKIGYPLESVRHSTGQHRLFLMETAERMSEHPCIILRYPLAASYTILFSCSLLVLRGEKLLDHGFEFLDLAVDRVTTDNLRAASFHLANR